MKNLFAFSTWAIVLLGAMQAGAVTSSPYATTTTGPLNQSFTDNINGSLAVATNAPAAGSLAALTDAISSTSPTGSVRVAADTATATLSWDLGTLINPALRKLNTVSIWFTDNVQRLGFNGSLATSLDGVTYTAIADSVHSVGFDSSPGSFHNVVYDFTGTNVSNFRFVQLISSGFLNVNDNSTTQPEFVEVDINTVTVPEPTTLALLAGGAAAGFLLRKRKH